MRREGKRVVALGFFDGVHRGHAALLDRAKAQAQALGALPTVLTFDIHPGQFISGERVPLINSLRDRVALIERLYGIKDVVVIPFDEALRRTAWSAFLESLGRELQAVHLICGHNFHFGYQGDGNVLKLQAACGKLGMGCDVVPEVSVEDVPVSSTYIRKLLTEGEMERAGRFLGHPHVLTETVGHGRKLGRTIGVPTINLTIPPEVLIPARGVYATRVFLPEEESGYAAVTNIGTRSTVETEQGLTVETYLLDFAGDLYGRRVRVEFYRYLRAERKFSDLQALGLQIQRDAAAARAYFEAY